MNGFSHNSKVSEFKETRYEKEIFSLLSLDNPILHKESFLLTEKFHYDLFITDTQRGVLPGGPESAICVQRFDDSLNSAIRITYRISLRSSSWREPRYPLLRVVLMFLAYTIYKTYIIMYLQ